MNVLLHLAILAVTVFVVSRVMPGLVRVRSVGTAVGVAVVFSVLNFFLGWLIKAALFIPGLLTFGLLFLFLPLIVNAVLLWATDKLMSGFELRGVRGLFTAALIITVVNWLFTMQTSWTHYTVHGAPRWV
jgi:putative membrane protein